MCGANFDGVWEVDPMVNVWPFNSIFLNLPGRKTNLVDAIDAYVSLTPTEADGMCKEAMSNSFCDAVTDVAFIRANVKFFEPSTGANLNYFDVEHLQDVGKALAKKTNINIDAFPVVEWNNRSNADSGEFLLMIPRALLTNPDDVKAFFKGDYDISSPFGSEKVTARVEIIQLDAQFTPSKKSVDGGFVAGMIILAVVIAAALVGGVFFYRRRKYGYFLYRPVRLN